MSADFQVLLLDDDAYMLNAYKRMLRTASFQCHFEQHCQPARDFLIANPTDLLLVDYLMPEQNGLDFCADKSGWAQHTNCYLLTGMDGIPELRQALEQGLIHGLLAKPIAKAELLHFITQQQQLRSQAL